MDTGSTSTMRVKLWPQTYAVARLRALPDNVAFLEADGAPAALVVRHGDITVLAPEESIAFLGDVAIEVERGWRALTLDTTMSFGTIGLLAAATRALAEVGVPVLAFASFATDHFLVPAGQVSRAVAALNQAALERFLGPR
jgi:uncharacterized protein